jgi:hypothetical protein
LFAPGEAPVNVRPELAQAVAHAARQEAPAEVCHENAEVAVPGWIIGAGKACRAHVGEHVRGVKGLMPGIGARHKELGKSIEHPPLGAPVVFAEIARVLMQEDGKGKQAKHPHAGHIGVGSADPASVTCITQAVTGGRILGLIDPSLDGRLGEGYGVKDGAHGDI